MSQTNRFHPIFTVVFLGALAGAFVSLISSTIVPTRVALALGLVGAVLAVFLYFRFSPRGILIAIAIAYSGAAVAGSFALVLRVQGMDAAVALGSQNPAVQIIQAILAVIVAIVLYRIDLKEQKESSRHTQHTRESLAKKNVPHLEREPTSTERILRSVSLDFCNSPNCS